MAVPRVDIMVDIETLDNSKTAVILQIGAVVFNRKTGEIIDGFKTNIEAKSCVNRGLTLGTDTITWWMQQAKEAQESVTAPGCSLYEGLKGFKEWIEKYAQPKKVNLWCHASFDEPILNNAYEKCRIELPWYFTGTRDLRTLVDLSGVNIYAMRRSGTYHDAVDDCKHQVKYAVACMEALGLNKE